MTPVEGSAPPEGGGEGSAPPEGGGEGSAPPVGGGEGSAPPAGGGKGSAPPAGGGAGAKLSARGFLGPVLLTHIESVRANARRVVATSAHGAEPDEEAVHDFRVSLRRLRTLLKPARRIYGKKRLRPIADGLREFARATGTLRDEEVLRETLTALELGEAPRAAVAAWVAQRSRREHEARAHIVELLRRDRPGDKGAPNADARAGDADVPRADAPPAGEADVPRAGAPAAGDADEPRAGAPAAGDADEPRAGAPAKGKRLRLEPYLARLERRISRKKAKKRGAEALARRAIRDALQDVRALAASDPGDGAAMHALRIRFKRLRYSAETFSPLFGERAERTAKSASRLQRRLGQLHDVDEALAQMTRAEELSPDDRAAVVEALGAERTRLAGKATEELAQELETLASLWSDAPPAPPPG
ncbi:CHAD domain-containing protein [Sorangium sp. So ce542]|uniref:CHAD domain-containing protein n=1 Tax=Sorangium sp. So ce542 TaxID=3133316 RepID=UPI003F5E80A0